MTLQLPPRRPSPIGWCRILLEVNFYSGTWCCFDFSHIFTCFNTLYADMESCDCQNNSPFSKSRLMKSGEPPKLLELPQGERFKQTLYHSALKTVLDYDFLIHKEDFFYFLWPFCAYV